MSVIESPIHAGIGGSGGPACGSGVETTELVAHGCTIMARSSTARCGPVNDWRSWYSHSIAAVASACPLPRAPGGTATPGSRATVRLNNCLATDNGIPPPGLCCCSTFSNAVTGRGLLELAWDVHAVAPASRTTATAIAAAQRELTNHRLDVIRNGEPRRETDTQLDSGCELV